MSKFLDLQFIRLNVDELHKYQISVISHSKYIVSLKSSEYKIDNLFESIHSIYYRKLFLPSLENYDNNYHTFMQKEIYTFIVGMVDSFQGKILTAPSILRKVENKIFQLKVSTDLNFLLPSSLISNDSNQVNKFSTLKTVAKPLSTGKLTTTTAVHSNIITDNVSDISLSPTYFQEYISKDYELRITVIKNTFYCVKIIADNKIDWRESEDNNLYELIDTPEVVRQECLDFLSTCNLDFGAFDYIVSDGKYYFLECNPNGQWLWLEMKLGLDISEAIVGYLND
jgi:glutathione synthase/RimK-type ligase-like ATP-grasp enzyme